MNDNEEQLAFYYNLGLAITEWAHVEHSLGAVLRVVDTPDRHASREFHDFSRWGSFRQQLDLVNWALAESHRSAEQLRAWRALRKRCDRTYTKRNALAHNTVVNYPSEREGRRMALVQWRTVRADRLGPQALCVRDIVGCMLAFTALSRALHNFSLVLRGKPKLYREELEKPEAAPTLAYIRRDLRGLLHAAELIQRD